VHYYFPVSQQKIRPLFQRSENFRISKSVRDIALLTVINGHLSREKNTVRRSQPRTPPRSSFLHSSLHPFPQPPKIPIPTHQSSSSHHCYGNTRSGNRVEAPQRPQHWRETDERAPELALAGHRHRPRRPRREEFDPQTGLLHQSLRLLSLYLRESSLRPRRRRSQQQDAARPVHLRRLLGAGLAGSRSPRRQAPPRKTPSRGHARALSGPEGPKAQFRSQKRVLGK